MPIMTTHIPNFSLRFATRRDLPILHKLIKELALFEKRPDDMTASLDRLADGIFSKVYAEVLLAEYAGTVIGYALFYPVFASFVGRPELFLEDLFILPEYRGKGLGKEFLRQIAKLAKTRDWYALRWNCLDWNDDSIHFYLAIGASKSLNHVSFSLHGNALKNFVEQ